MRYTVSQLAAIARVSVRTLHHYDAIGLLVPSARSEAGYRLYAHSELERLEQILIFRELAFPLEEIRRILDDPGFDRVESLREQRRLLVQRASQAEGLVRAIDRALEAEQQGKPLKGEIMFEAFEEETKSRWGETREFAVAAERMAGYRSQDRAAMRSEAEATEQALAGLLAQGVPATDASAKALAEQHRLHIDRWFYPCPARMHVALAEMYVEDARFREHYEQVRPGLAVYLRDAIRANAAEDAV